MNIVHKNDLHCGDKRKATHASPEELTWFDSIESKSEMAVEQMHRKYNKVTNYGSKPSMKKFATVFARMELIRRDQWKRYKNCFATGMSLPHTRGTHSKWIDRRVKEVRDAFVDHTFNHPEYDKEVAVTYLEDMYRALYPAKEVDQWKNAGRYVLRWL